MDPGALNRCSQSGQTVRRKSAEVTVVMGHSKRTHRGAHRTATAGEHGKHIDVKVLSESVPTGRAAGPPERFGARSHPLVPFHPEWQDAKFLPRFTFGAVAQLGEHLVCNQGVAGSIPVRSTFSH